MIPSERDEWHGFWFPGFFKFFFQTASQLRSDLVSYLRSNPTSPDGIHYGEFINHGGWDSYPRRMSMDGEWGDWIALWGLTNMLNITVALVSSLGEAGLKIINPNARDEDTGDFGALALLGHEAEVHFHSLEPASDTANPKNVVSELKDKYGEGKVIEEICPNCGKKFQCFSKGVFEGANGMLQVYSDDNAFCDNCQKYEFNYMLKWTLPARTLHGRRGFIRDKDLLFRLKL